MVDQDRFEDEADNADAKFLAQRNHRAKEETRAKNTNLLHNRKGGEEAPSAPSENQQPEPGMDGGTPAAGHITRIDHIVLHVPDVPEVSRRFLDWFGVATKRTMERGTRRFAFMRPGDVVIEVIGPLEPGPPGSGFVAGLAFEVKGIDALSAALKAKGCPAGDPHPALQGGRIASVHPSGACGVPVAFIDFTDSAQPTSQ